MKKYITERTNGQLKTTEIKWNPSKHYNLLYAYNDVGGALDYINDIEELTSRYKHLT